MLTYCWAVWCQILSQIFGPNEDESLDLEATERQFKELTETINKDLDVKMSPAEVAFGFLKVANESMARSIRAITEAKRSCSLRSQISYI
nr:BPK_HP1_G0042760.mRNA.1.CDS.1 [Saccharomyces cerevisiae]